MPKRLTSNFSRGPCRQASTTNTVKSPRQPLQRLLVGGLYFASFSRWQSLNSQRVHVMSQSLLSRYSCAQATVLIALALLLEPALLAAHAATLGQRRCTLSVHPFQHSVKKFQCLLKNYAFSN